jgi:hypothetical protein
LAFFGILLAARFESQEAWLHLNMFGFALQPGGDHLRVNLRGSSLQGPIFVFQHFPACTSEFPGGRVGTLFAGV